MHDVRYILAKDHDTGNPLVFRNEDTGWGWPPYFKFDSAELSSQAADIANNKRDAVVLLTYYGVRSSMSTCFPTRCLSRSSRPDTRISRGSTLSFRCCCVWLWSTSSSSFGDCDGVSPPGANAAANRSSPEPAIRQISKELADVRVPQLRRV